jgi:FkbM family methyltransferase
MIGTDRVLDFTFLDNAVKLYIPYSHTDLIQKTILLHRTFFENYLLLRIYKSIEPGSVIADIGANIGNHTVFFGLCCKAEKVISFEPLKVAYNILQRNVEINKLQNVDAHNVAVGIQGDRLSLERCTPTNLGGSQFISSDKGDYSVVSLDSLKLEKLDFIKLDVEGSQSPVLIGAKETITSLRPKILVEVLQGEEEVFEEFSNLGYSITEKIGKTDYLLTSSKATKWT